MIELTWLLETILYYKGEYINYSEFCIHANLPKFFDGQVKEIWKGIDYAGQRIEKEFSKPQRPDSAVPATTTTTAAETTDTRTESMPVLKENTPDEISFTTDSDEPLTEVPGPTEPFSESSSDRPDWQVNSEILRKILDQLELYPEDPFE